MLYMSFLSLVGEALSLDERRADFSEVKTKE